MINHSLSPPSLKNGDALRCVAIFASDKFLLLRAHNSDTIITILKDFSKPFINVVSAAADQKIPRTASLRNYLRKEGVSMASPNKQSYTTEDIYSLPDGQRAELIDGTMYMMAPPNRIHQKLVSELTQVIGNHIKSKKGSCEIYPAPFAVFLNADEKNYVEPDISVICDTGRLTEKGGSGAPNWIIEIVSPGSQRMDYLTKLFKYRTAGVREYWIVDPSRETVQAYLFGDSEDFHQFSFTDSAPVGIFNDLQICIANLVKDPAASYGASNL